MALLGAAACGALTGCTHADQADRTRSGSAGHAPTTSATIFAAPAPAPPQETVPASTTTVPPASDSCGSPPVIPSPPGLAPTTTAPSTSWDEQTVVAGTCPQVVDLAARAGFALVSDVPTDQGPWVLQRIDLDRATTETGPSFSDATLAVASGYLWISCGRGVAGDGLGPVLCQVDPITLTVVRQIPLPPPDVPAWGEAVVVVAGPDGTVWAGYGRALVHVAVADGALLSTETIASGTVASLSVDPAGLSLYVALSYPTVAGRAVDASVLEFDARTGQALAATPADSAVTNSVSGGTLTAVPGGVWMSFRVGMSGETLLLRQSDLAVVGPPTSALEQAQPDGVFSWIMDASTIYGAGALLLVNEDGVMACIDPETAAIRVEEHLAGAEASAVQLLAVDGASRQVFVTDGNGLEAITPPPACWG